MSTHSIISESRRAFLILACGVLGVALVYVLAGVWTNSERAMIAAATLCPSMFVLWTWSIRLVWTGDTISRQYLFGAICHSSFSLRDLRRISVLRDTANRVMRVTLHFPTGKVRFWSLQTGFPLALRRLEEETPYLFRFATQEWW